MDFNNKYKKIILIIIVTLLTSYSSGTVAAAAATTTTTRSVQGGTEDENVSIPKSGCKISIIEDNSTPTPRTSSSSLTSLSSTTPSAVPVPVPSPSIIIINNRNVKLKRLECYNVTLEIVNNFLSSKPSLSPTTPAATDTLPLASDDAKYNYFRDITLKHVRVNSNMNTMLQFNINSNFIEMIEWTDSNLTDLDIEHLFTTSIKRKLINLKILNLSNNDLDQLPFNFLKYFDNLLELYLNDNHLNDNLIDKFEGLTNLLRLDLSNNNIYDLPRNIFNGLNNLKLLNLSINSLHIIPFQTFKELKNLEVLDISNNELGLFLDNFFLLNRNLRELYVKNNTLKKLNKNSLYGLNNLEKLDLSDNNITVIDRNAFDSLKSLLFLDLSSNTIKTLPSIVFSSLHTLNHLILSNNNNMSYLPSGIFSQQINLKHLELDSTNITVLSNWISRNNNNTVNQQILKNLQILSITNNRKLTDIQSVFFMNLPEVRILYLSNNNIQVLPKSIDHMVKLEYLDLENNQLTAIPEEIRNLEHLKSLNLMENRLGCDCNIYWIKSWIDDMNIENSKNLTLPYELLRLNELNCHGGYRGDVLNVLQELKCKSPELLHASDSQMHLLNSDAILECKFKGDPTPDIIWITPSNKILRHNSDPDQKQFQIFDDIDTNSNNNNHLPNQNGHSNEKYQTHIEYQMLKANNDNATNNFNLASSITLLEDGFLKVHNISRKDSGLYRCYAFNVMGNSTADIR